MSSTRPGALYRASNIALDLATMGIFTARYKHGWANAWCADGRLHHSSRPYYGAYHQPHFYAVSTEQQHQQQEQTYYEAEKR